MANRTDENNNTYESITVNYNVDLNRNITKAVPGKPNVTVNSEFGYQDNSIYVAGLGKVDWIFQRNFTFMKHTETNTGKLLSISTNGVMCDTDKTFTEDGRNYIDKASCHDFIKPATE